VSYLGIPRRTAVLTTANGVSSAGQGQFMFVLPWMMLARGSTPTEAALSTAFVYAPLLAFAIPSGAVADRTDPVRLLRNALVAIAASSALYPLSVLVGQGTFWLVLAAAIVAGGMRDCCEAAVLRGIADTTSGAELLRAHAVRTTVNQAAIFGSPFIGLLLYWVGGSSAVLTGIVLLQLAGVAVLMFVPPIGAQRLAHAPPSLGHGIASLRANDRLRVIGWASLTWNVFVGAAFGIMPGVLREYLGMDELAASVTLVAGGVAVVVLTLPIVRGSQRRLGPISTFVVAVLFQAVSVLLLANVRLALLAPLAYAAFLLANSSAAASLNGARALEVELAHQALVSLALATIGLAGFVVGIVLGATLLQPLGFEAVLVLIAVGMAATALGFRRPLVV
jgi:MFS family permease